MSRPEQSTVRNRLLRALSPDDYALLQPHLELIKTELGQPLIKAQQPIRQMYFPEVGFGSMTSSGSERKVEIGLIGREGLVGALPVLLGSDRMPYEQLVQHAGGMLRIETVALLAAVNDSASLHNALLCLVQVQFVQTAQTAFANATATLDVRLARWLLMCRDRIDSDDIHITHDFLSVMLGVTRSSTTLAVQALEGRQLIKAQRGKITLRDREAMEAVADATYGLPEAEFARLIEGT
jgi:CRP-like cAMP-binding protein